MTFTANDLVVLGVGVLVMILRVIPAVDSLMDRRHRDRVEREYAKKTGVRGKIPEAFYGAE